MLHETKEKIKWEDKKKSSSSSSSSNTNTNTNHWIQEIGTTSDKLTSRAGLSLFVRYLDKTGIKSLIDAFFGSLRKSCKGKKIYDIFKQVFCFFIDGMSRHLTYFDSLKEDEGYGASIEFNVDELCSSHIIKRFFGTFSYLRNRLFRRLLQRIFIWRLNLEKPSLILLDIDTMVMNNDDAEKRHGVSPTYKKKKGFQPYLVKWERYIIDAVFRGGKKHSNHGNTVKNSLDHIVKLIRSEYRVDVPIIVTCDSGFFDQKLFEFFENELFIGYVCSGKIYDDIVERVSELKRLNPEEFLLYEKRGDKDKDKDNDNGSSKWRYVEFQDRRQSWKKDRRALYSECIVESNQRLLFPRPWIYYTNIGVSHFLTHQLEQAGAVEYLELETILKLAHSRGEAELVHRNFKEFGFEQMPFKQFCKNAAFFYTMVLSFNLYECYKADVCKEVIKISAQPNTFRRLLIDIAGKIVRHSGKCILKVSNAVKNTLCLDRLWELCNKVPVVSLN